jgi:hypothetical protein
METRIGDIGARTLLPTILALLLGFALGLVACSFLQVPRLGGTTEGDDAVVRFEGDDAVVRFEGDDAIAHFKSKILPGALNQFSASDLGLFATVELVLQSTKSKDGQRPVLCLGMIKDDVATDGPPIVPEWIINWIGESYPDQAVVVSLADCVESWGAPAEIRVKKTYKDAQLFLVYYPEQVFRSFIRAAVNRIIPIPGALHTNGSSFLFQINRSGVRLMGHETFRSYY